MRGHIPGSRPLVLGSPPPAADEASARALAQEIALRLRRHGITGRERLVLVDRGDGVGAMPAAQMAELAGHPRVAILLGGMAGWEGELEGPGIVASCHSGSRSALATLALRAAGYEARNYAGSWHEWSRHDELPLER